MCVCGVGWFLVVGYGANGGVGWALAKELASRCTLVCQNYPLANYPLVSPGFLRLRETLCESGRWINALKKRGRVLKKRGRVLKKRGRFLRSGV